MEMTMTTTTTFSECGILSLKSFRPRQTTCKSDGAERSDGSYGYFRHFRRFRLEVPTWKWRVTALKILGIEFRSKVEIR